MNHRGRNPVHKALSQFSGCKVEFAYELCWPVLVLNLDLAVLTPQRTSATALFILRLAKHGVIELAEFANLLGMPNRMILGPLAELITGGFLSRSSDTKFTITGDGARLIESAGITMRPQIRSAEVPFDPIGRKMLDLEVDDLVYADEVAKDGRFILPDHGDRPLLNELRITEVRKYVQTQGLADWEHEEISGVVGVSDRYRDGLRYRDGVYVVALSRQSASEVIFALYGGDDYLPAESSHIQYLWESGRRDIVPDEHRPAQDVLYSVSPWEQSRSVSTDEILLLDAVQDDDSISKDLQNAVAAAETSLRDTGDSDTRPALERQIVQFKSEQAQVNKRLATSELRLRSQTDGEVHLIKTEEHRPLLLEAIDQATTRLTLVSAWIGPEAFDVEVCEKLSRALARKVRVEIAWGLGTTKGAEAIRNGKKGENALRMLRSMTPRDRQDDLIVKRTETHEKFIICDDKFCAWGSFNWLSYRGELDRGYRRESSFYSERPDDIDLWKANAESLFQI